MSEEGKKKYRYAVRMGLIVLAVLAILAALAVLAGSLAAGRQYAGQQPWEQPFSGEEKAIRIEEAKPLDEDAPGSRAERLTESAGGMLVEVRTDSSSGSGVIFAVTQEELCIVTAAHVLDQGNGARDLRIGFADGSEADCPEFWAAQDADIAFLRIPLDRLDAGTAEQCRYAATDKTGYDALGCGDTVFCMGMQGSAGVRAFEGFLTDNWIYVEDFAQYMMVADCPIYPGMSGGGLYDARGYLIGIVCGGNDSGELAAVPLHVVQAKYAEQY